MGLGVALASTLAACGSEGKPTLTWYLNPDGQETLAAIAERCSTDEYDIQTRLLPTSATDQRVQLARRLAAEDSQTDLMNLDPVFVPEFANAGWLLELPEDTVTDDTLEGIAETVRWDDGIYAAPRREPHRRPRPCRPDRRGLHGGCRRAPRGRGLRLTRRWFERHSAPVQRIVELAPSEP